MTISFNTVPANTLVPLFYAEMDNSAANTTQDSAPALLLGYANTGSAIATSTLVLMPSADYAKQICGAGSQLARMVEAYRATDPFGELYVIAVPEPAAGTTATITLTVTGAATESGIVNVYIGRTRIQAAVVNGDDVAAVAASISAAVNADATLPFTASAALGVVTLTARHKGLCGNEIPVALLAAMKCCLPVSRWRSPPALPVQAHRICPGRSLRWRMNRLTISVIRSTTRRRLTPLPVK